MEFLNPGIVGVGAPIVDVLLQVSEAELAGCGAVKGTRRLVPPSLQDEILTRLNQIGKLTVGGSAGNTMLALARLGVKSALWGKVGLDMYGQLFCQDFCNQNGVLDKFLFTDQLPTARCLSLITPDAERTMFTSLGAAGAIAENEIAAELFDGFGMAYFEGYAVLLPYIEKLLKMAKNAGAKIGWDLNDHVMVTEHKAELQRILTEYVDVLFANETEAAALVGEFPPEETVRKLLAFAPVAVLKLGENGSMAAFDDGSVVKMAALDVAAKDTTAAGDLFQAGFLYGLLNGQTPDMCLFYGTVLAGEVVQVVGTQIPPERWAAIQLKMKLIK